MSISIFHSMHQRYRDSLLFNKNLIISGICSLVLSSFIYQEFFEQDWINNVNVNVTAKNNNVISGNSGHAAGKAFADSILTLATEYCIDTPIFAVLYYYDNRQRFTDKTGKKDLTKIKEDIKKLLAVFSISEVSYIVVKVSTQYQLLQLQQQMNIEPYQASMLS